MKVKELIEQLQKFDGELTIFLNGEDGLVPPYIGYVSNRDKDGINFLFIERDKGISFKINYMGKTQ
jgi:hypothetical protein